MGTFDTWWASLTALNQVFYLAAVFFSVILLWQLIASLLGLGGGEGDLTSHVDSASVHASPDDAHDSVTAFKLVSVRSILAFFTLFSWATAMYTNKVGLAGALGRGVAWGVAGMLVVSVLIYMIGRMAQTGTIRISSCVGNTGTVYLDIAENGVGEIRTLCSGTMTHLKARTVNGAGLKAGQEVRIVKVLDVNTVEVDPVVKS